MEDAYLSHRGHNVLIQLSGDPKNLANIGHNINPNNTTASIYFEIILILKMDVNTDKFGNGRITKILSCVRTLRRNFTFIIFNITSPLSSLAKTIIIQVLYLLQLIDSQTFLFHQTHPLLVRKISTNKKCFLFSPYQN